MELHQILSIIMPDGIWPYLDLMYKASLILIGAGAAVSASYLLKRRHVLKILGFSTLAGGLLAYFFTHAI